MAGAAGRGGAEPLRRDDPRALAIGCDRLRRHHPVRDPLRGHRHQDLRGARRPARHPDRRRGRDPQEPAADLRVGGSHPGRRDRLPVRHQPRRRHAGQGGDGLRPQRPRPAEQGGGRPGGAEQHRRRHRQRRQPRAGAGDRERLRGGHDRGPHRPGPDRRRAPPARGGGESGVAQRGPSGPGRHRSCAARDGAPSAGPIPAGGDGGGSSNRSGLPTAGADASRRECSRGRSWASLEPSRRRHSIHASAARSSFAVSTGCRSSPGSRSRSEARGDAPLGPARISPAGAEAYRTLRATLEARREEGEYERGPGHGHRSLGGQEHHRGQPRSLARARRARGDPDRGGSAAAGARRCA